MESISAFVESTLFAKLIGPLTVIALLCFFWWRAGTIHSLFERLWRLAAGNMDVHDSKLKEFIHTNRDLEKFRFLYGLKVDTLDSLHRLLAWLNANKIGISSAQIAKRWIDMKSPDFIKCPTKEQARNIWLGLVFWTLLSAGSIPFIAHESALLQTKGTEVWFFVDSSSMRHVGGNWNIELTRCDSKETNGIQKDTGFSKFEVDSLCKSYQDGTLQPFVQQTVKGQRWFIGAMTAICILMLISAFFGAMSIREAAAIKEKIGTDVGSLDSDEGSVDSLAIEAEGRQPSKTSKRKNIETPLKSDSREEFST